jgi:hypothetical protein
VAAKSTHLIPLGLLLSGVVLPARAADWAVMNSGTTSTLVSVWGSGPTQVFAVGGQGVIRRFDGSSWSSTPSDTTDFLTDVFGTSPNDVFLTQYGYSGGVFNRIYWGSVRRLGGPAWPGTGAFPVSYTYRSAWASGPNDVLATYWKDSPTSPFGVAHYDGSTVTTWSVSLFSRNHLWGSGPNNVFVAGSSGYIARYTGSGWTGMTTGTSRTLTRLWGVGPTSVFAVGEAGTILHYDGSIWAAMSSPTTADLYSVYGTGPNNVFAVGAAGTILHYDGAAWSSMDSGTTQNLNGVWACSGEGAFAVAVGTAGTVVRYGTPWWPPAPGDGGFEFSLPVRGYPAGCGPWSGDWATTVRAENGIAPCQGQRMLKFLGCSTFELPSSIAHSRVIQVVDLHSLRTRISAGNALARARASFNRVTGDAQTDTRFSLDLYAYAGDPNTFLTQWGRETDLAWQSASLNTDGDPTTWEPVVAELTLPANTDFVAVQVVAWEDVYNDVNQPEFDGHYADAVSLEIIPQHHLALDVVNNSWGAVEIQPDQPLYVEGTPATLTATPIDGKSFKEWLLYDPCHPNDTNYATTDANNPLTIIMDADRQVTAAFKCGSGAEQALPLLVVGIGVLGLAAYRRRAG